MKEVELGDQFVKSCTIGLKGFISKKDRPSTTKIEIGQKQTFSSSYYIRFGKQNSLKTYLVEDLSPQLKPLSKEVFRLNPLKRKKLLDFCLAKEKFFLDKKVFLS